MVLDNNSMQKLIGEGVSFVGSDGKPIMKRTSKKAPSSNSIAITLEENESDVETLDALHRIEGLLSKILSKPAPQIKSPDVIVKPPNVTVNPPAIVNKPPDVIVHQPAINIPAQVTPIFPDPPKPIRHWKFVLQKDHMGRTTEITATALE